MPEQMSLEGESRAVSVHRVEALATTLAGYVAPGYGGWAKVPERVKRVCRAAARNALVEAAEGIEGGS